MWTAKNRGQCDRRKLRHPNYLTGDEWAYAGPVIPPAKRGGNKCRVDGREGMNGRSKLCKQRLRKVMDVVRTGASGGRFRNTCHRAARISTILPWEPTTAPWIASIPRFMRRAGSEANGRPAPPATSSIAIGHMRILRAHDHCVRAPAYARPPMQIKQNAG